MTDFAGTLLVLELTERGVLCATSLEGEPFWLPRAGHVRWEAKIVAGQETHAVVPGWLASKHRQLAGDIEYERIREGLRKSRSPDEQIAKGHQMSDRQDDTGSGALFKNDNKEKPTHPDYRGDVTIHGRKFWASGWIKEGKRGKYLSLAFRAADEERERPSASARALAHAPLLHDDILS